jgi:hypothetical protein
MSFPQPCTGKQHACPVLPAQNALLAVLPNEAGAPEPETAWVQMPAGSVVFEPGVPMRGVFFPRRSCRDEFRMENGGSAGGTDQGEGMVGVRLLLGDST